MFLQTGNSRGQDIVPFLAKADSYRYIALGMRIRSVAEFVFRLAMTACVLGLVWSIVAADGPPATNAPIAELGNQAQFVRQNASILTFGLDSLPSLRGSLAGRPLWQYVATAMYIALAFLAARIFDWILRYQARHWVSGKVAQWDAAVVRRTAAPLKWVLFLAIIDLGLELFDWPDWIESWISRINYVAIGISLVLVMVKIVDAAVIIWRTKLPPDGDRVFNDQLIRLLGKLLKSAGIVVGSFTICSHLGIDIRAALASVSVAGLALGLAAQDTVANLFGAVAVFVDRPFKIGDRIRVGEVDGVVEDMGIRATRVRSVDGFLITVPNKTVGNTVVTNISSRQLIRTELNFGLTYDTPSARVERAVQIVDEVFRGHPKTKDLTVYFNRFLDSSLNLNVVYVCGTTDWKEYCSILQSMNLKIKDRFDREGLSFAFPTQTTIHQFPPSASSETLPKHMVPNRQP